MKCDGKYIGDIVVILVAFFFATFLLYIGYSNNDPVFISGSALLFSLGILVEIESIGKRIRDDIVSELNGDNK